MTVGMLRDMVDSLGLSPKLSDIRLVAAALLAFSAFLRFDELSKLRCYDISFADSVLSVHVSSSKTDQFRQGDTVVIARTGNITCPSEVLASVNTTVGSTAVFTCICIATGQFWLINDLATTHLNHKHRNVTTGGPLPAPAGSPEDSEKYILRDGSHVFAPRLLLHFSYGHLVWMT